MRPIKFAGDFLEPRGHLERVLAAFHLARTGDQNERQMVAESSAPEPATWRGPVF